MNEKLLLCSVIVGVLINFLLPLLVEQFATEEQTNPPDGAANLSFLDQLVHMLVHHAQVPLSSSVLIAVIVGLSVALGEMCAKSKLF